MRYLPGSHRLLNEHWRRVLRADQRKYLPRVRSMRPDPHGWCRRAKEQHGQQWPALPHFPEGLAELPGRSRWHDQQPVAAVARRGQLMVWTSGLLHAAHYNATNRPRKAITMGWCDDRLVVPQASPDAPTWPEAHVAPRGRSRL